MNINKIIFLFIIAITQLVPTASASCIILNSANQIAQQQSDTLGIILSNNTCPHDVLQFREILQKHGLKLETHMVANRGFHNPKEGSFSLFESVSGQLDLQQQHHLIQPGDFFFGHFTTIDKQGYLTLDQNPAKNSLMIEAFAWDLQKGVFNFYELRGNGKEGQWFYRGDSKDIYADNQLLHLQSDSLHPKFGTRLRCAACHSAGGPIMKELYEPHNDWWQNQRKLDFGGRIPDKKLQAILDTLLPASNLSQEVSNGLRRLNNSIPYNKFISSLSLPEQLRPLFCPMEINFKSDTKPNNEMNTSIAIPLEFFVDERLLSTNEKPPLIINRKDYETFLIETKSRFPETNDKDADHAWLTPVKALSDKIAVENLMKNGLIDQPFMLAVLAVDMTNPVFSTKRCQLLKHLPLNADNHWQQKFIANLAKSNDIGAKELAKNLINPHPDSFYKLKAASYIARCQDKLRNIVEVRKLYSLLLQRREEIRASEISANPKGEILEPGFRVIFPKTIADIKPGLLALSENCEVNQKSP